MGHLHFQYTLLSQIKQIIVRMSLCMWRSDSYLSYKHHTVMYFQIFSPKNSLYSCFQPPSYQNSTKLTQKYGSYYRKHFKHTLRLKLNSEMSYSEFPVPEKLIKVRVHSNSLFSKARFLTEKSDMDVFV